MALVIYVDKCLPTTTTNSFYGPLLAVKNLHSLMHTPVVSQFLNSDFCNLDGKVTLPGGFKIDHKDFQKLHNFCKAEVSSGYHLTGTLKSLYFMILLPAQCTWVKSLKILQLLVLTFLAEHV